MKNAIQIVCVAAAAVAFGVGQAAVGANREPGDLLLSISNPKPSENANFGYSVAAVGDNILVGCPYDDTGARDAGAAYLFSGLTGKLLRTFSNPTPAERQEEINNRISRLCWCKGAAEPNSPDAIKIDAV